MKDAILKLLLPLCLVAAAAIAGWLADKGVITADQVANTTTEVQNGLNGLAAAAAGLLAIIGMWAWKKFFPGGGNGTGSSGGSFPCIILSAAALSFAGLALPSCSPANLAAFGNAFDAKAVITHADENGNSASVVIRPRRVVEQKSRHFDWNEPQRRGGRRGITEEFQLWDPLKDPLPQRVALQPAEYREVFSLHP